MNILYRHGKEVPLNAKAGKFGDDELAFEEFIKIHEIARGGMGAPVDQANYVAGLWLVFDGETEHFTGDHSVEAN